MNTKRRISYRAILILAAPMLAWLGVGLSQDAAFDQGLWRGLRKIHPAPIQWQTLDNGFERAVLKFEGESISQEPPQKIIARKIELVVFRIDPARYKVRVITAGGLFGQKKARLSDVHKRIGAALTVNGGFFSKEGDPMGLVISDGHKRADWSEEGKSGALAVYKNIVRIGWATNVVTALPQPDQALQNGPLLIEPVHVFGIIHIREKFFTRTIAAVDDKGRLLIGITRRIGNDPNINCGLNLYETAKIFYHPEEIGGLGAAVALNLDGGTSSGMELSLNQYRDRVPVGILLPNFICVMPPK